MDHSVLAYSWRYLPTLFQMTLAKTRPFEEHAAEYDSWYDRYPHVFRSEAEALREALPPGDLKGIEVGLGTGRFSLALGIKEGVEPAGAMRRIAVSRGIDAMNAVAERLPYKDLHYDFVLMASCLSYLSDIRQAFSEANRVLKRGGTLVAGFIPKESLIGKFYEAKRQDSRFYKEAVFYPPEKVADELKLSGFNRITFTQTLFGNLDEIKEFQPAMPGHDRGSFVVTKAIKK